MFCKLLEGLRRLHGPVLLLVAMTAGAALIVPSHASAQAVTGTLLGNVTDSSGAGDARRHRHHHRVQARTSAAAP